MVFSPEKPQSIASLIGNPTAFSHAREWAKKWAEGNAQKPLFVYGPTGVGKTALAHALASEFGWEIFEFNASSFRDEEAVTGLLANAASTGSLFGRTRLILVDDADSLSGNADRGGAGAIAKVLESPSQPVIVTATDIYRKKLSTIKTRCTVLELHRLHPSSIAALVKREAARKGISLAPEAAESIAKSVGGDARAALNDLAAGNFSANRDREKNIFEVVRTIMKSVKYSEARQAAFSSEVEHDTLKLWIAENIPAEYKSPFEVSEAYNSLSRADIFDGRIKRAQYWGYLRYSGDLMSSGVALAKSAPNTGYTPTSFPSYIRAMGASRGSRALRKSTLSKIARACHCSISQAQYYLPQIREAVKTDAQPLVHEFGFDEDEIAFLSDTSGKMAKAKAPKPRTAKKKV